MHLPKQLLTVAILQAYGGKRTRSNLLLLYEGHTQPFSMHGAIRFVMMELQAKYIVLEQELKSF